MQKNPKLQYPRTDETRQRMSIAKLGRKYNPSHRLNIRVSQILKWADKKQVCPVLHVMEHRLYSEEEIIEILYVIHERGDYTNVSQIGMKIINDL